MRKLLRTLVIQEQGQDLVEYAFLVGLIALVAYLGVTVLGTTINTYYGTTINNSPGFNS